jgi:hypothetical protein
MCRGRIVVILIAAIVTIVCCSSTNKFLIRLLLVSVPKGVLRSCTSSSTGSSISGGDGCIGKQLGFSFKGCVALRLCLSLCFVFQPLPFGLAPPPLRSVRFFAPSTPTTDSPAANAATAAAATAAAFFLCSLDLVRFPSHDTTGTSGG